MRRADVTHGGGARTSSERIVLRGWYTPIVTAFGFVAWFYFVYVFLILGVAFVTGYTDNAHPTMREQLIFWAIPFIPVFIVGLVASGTGGAELRQDEIICRAMVRWRPPERYSRSNIASVDVWMAEGISRNGNPYLSLITKQVTIKTKRGGRISYLRLRWFRHATALKNAQIIAKWADVPWTDPAGAPSVSPRG